MGCTQGITGVHDGFDFYTMGAAATTGSTTATTTATTTLLSTTATTTATTTVAGSAPGYVLNATNTKCAQASDRLFRATDLDLAGCYSKCGATSDCNYFSIALTGQYAGVCMGCTQGITETHVGFDFYRMTKSTTTTTTIQSLVGMVLDESDYVPNTKCAHNHPDRLFRMESSNIQDCFTECSNVESCNYFSIAEEGPYAGVCMGCVEGVTQPHQFFKFYTMPAAPTVQNQLSYCTEMPYEQRIDCGWWGVTPQECMDKGCCWQVDPVPNPNHIPYCFRHHTALPECEQSNEVKTDCGFYGITADECESRGCCYRQSPNPNPEHVPWCYPPAE